MDDLVTVPEAASVAGVSVRTMRRWMAGGQVTAVGRGHDRRVVAASIPRPADTGGQADHLAALVRDLVAENRQLAETAAMLAERVRVLGDQVALAALIPSESPGASNLTRETSETTSEPAHTLGWMYRGSLAATIVVVLVLAGLLLLR